MNKNKLSKLIVLTVAGVGGIVSATYCNMLANSMEEVNNNGQSGIVVNINWDLVYTVFSQ